MQFFLQYTVPAKYHTNPAKLNCNDPNRPQNDLKWPLYRQIRPKMAIVPPNPAFCHLYILRKPTCNY